MAEEQALHQGVGQGCTVHNDKGLFRPSAVGVGGSGKELLARAGFAGNEDTGVTACSLSYLLQASVDARA